MGFADALGADVDERSDSQLTAQTPWLLGAFVLESAAALLLTLQRILIAVPRIQALLPSAVLPISFEHRAQMTGILLQECSAQVLKGIVEGMDNVEWQRFFRSLTGASSAQGILTQKKWSILDAIQRGSELLEGSDFRREAGNIL